MGPKTDVTTGPRKCLMISSAVSIQCTSDGRTDGHWTTGLLPCYALRRAVKTEHVLKHTCTHTHSASSVINRVTHMQTCSLITPIIINIASKHTCAPCSNGYVHRVNFFITIRLWDRPPTVQNPMKPWKSVFLRILCPEYIRDYSQSQS